MPASARPDTATDSNSARPQSAPAAVINRPAPAGGDQAVCDRERGEGPQSAPDTAETLGHWAWRMVEFALDRFEAWDVRRPSRRELMDYARTGPYTLPTAAAKDGAGKVITKKTKLRKLGIAYAWLLATNLHSLVYGALWLLRQPSRALAKTSRPTLEQILRAVRNTSGPAQWVNVGYLAVSVAAYSALWAIERPSRVLATGGVLTVFRLALIFIGL